MSTPFTLAGRVAVVTGGARGLGLAIADTLTELGARVAIADLQPPADPFIGGPQSALVSRVDVTDEASVAAMVEQVQGQLGRIDILVNCAGIMYKDVVERLDLEKWNRVLGVNLTGPMLCAKHVVPVMKAQRHGRIINISSMMAVTAAETYSAYCATKAGLLQCTRVWAIELAPFGITVNAICPGWVLTPMSQQFIDRIASIHGVSSDEGLQRILSLVPQRRFLEPREVAYLTAFLATDAAGGITGTGQVVDAGTTAGMPYGVHRRLEESLGLE